ncbi:MAG: hypothetical protein ACXVX8_10115 [Blastococcus sp.]
MLFAVAVALSNNTTWSGHLDPHRVAGFLQESGFAFVLSFTVLLFLAWFRAQTQRGAGPKAAQRTSTGSSPAARAQFEPYPWTDRWLRDWREADARHGSDSGSAEFHSDRLPVTCRHGVPVDAPTGAEQAPVLRALSTSHSIVPPGSSVSVTWCFEHSDDVVVDGAGGYPACGEARVRIERSRRVEVAGRNRYGSTPVATATVVAMAVPQLHLPTLAAPPPVSMQADVAATVGPTTPITQRLDDFWATQESLRPRIGVPAQLVGVPDSVIDGLRLARRQKREH